MITRMLTYLALLLVVGLSCTHALGHAPSKHGWGIQSLTIYSGPIPNRNETFIYASHPETAVSSTRVRRQAAATAGWVSSVSSAFSTVSQWATTAAPIISAVTGVINCITGIQNLAQQRQQMEIQQRQFEQQMELQVTELCDQICVTEWGPWSMCDSRCGGGWASRNRSRFETARCEGRPCRHSTYQQAICNQGCPNGGLPFLGGGGCDCPVGIAGECCENQVMCPFPGSPQYGELESGGFPALYGAVVQYTCNEGFAIVGDTFQVCTETGEWRGTKPTCQRVTCASPGEPQHGLLINRMPTYLFGDQAAYMCNEGYQLIGPETRRCSSIGESMGRWTGFTPMCLPISCGSPNYPLYGHMEGTEFTLGRTVTYSCSNGFRLVGSRERTCLSHGAWGGNEPECQPIACEEPYAPDHGHVVRPRDQYMFGMTVRFQCDPGYLINGTDTLRCTEDPDGSFIGPGGIWDSPYPNCQASICGELGELENGVKDGSLFYFPHSVNLQCFAGYALQGVSTLECGANGVWSAPMPECEACPLGMFKSDSDPETDCQMCPENTETLSEASTSIQQCICVEGYSGDGQGNCQEIRCPVLEAPEFGVMGECGNLFNARCEFDCQDGYIMERGSSSRTCDEYSEWTGSDPVCIACPKDTFKSDMRSCLPCPRHSHTLGEGSAQEDCVCDAGYIGEPGHECEDDNECDENDGRGPCSDVCENTDGDYRCLCSIPGYVIDPAFDKNTCKLDRSCRNLTIDDAPVHGGLVCHWYWEENSQQCSVRCNRGYEFPARTNNYELCGPTTGYQWSHEERAEVIEPCVPEFFPDFQMEASSAYFVRACHDLTTEEQEDVKRQFAQTLTDEGVCVKRETQVCEMRDVGIICGRTRRRRSLDGLYEDVDEVDFSFRVQAIQIENKVVNCSTICEFLSIPKERCESLCHHTYKRFLRAAVMYSQRQLTHIFANRGGARFHAAERIFEPQEEALQTSDIVTQCQPGMRSEGDLCIPCLAGTYYNAISNQCVKCPRATYQPEDRGETCYWCPEGTVSFTPGAAQCDKCPPGRFGQMCGGECGPCVHGECNAVTGLCDCHSGWEGDSCAVDSDGCANGVSCYPGVVCEDVAAPGTGYHCGACPDGMIGDGIRCSH